MRKMNKIVSLALVLAMALSMMASAASFKDQEAINADLIDEINMMLALNVYSEQGTGAGYFEPNGTITRSQAAKIIYVLKNKGVDNGATSWTGLNIFDDVEAGSWYEGYVNYCASVGIIAGTGDNKFTPNGQLTGVELAKMLLVVIGYKADVEGYTGAKWDANILADAEAAGFFVDYELPVRGVVTREWAAKMIVNAINATKVKYEDGEAVEMYNQSNNPITYANQDLGLEEKIVVPMGTAKFTLNTTAVGAPTTHGVDGKVSTVYIKEVASNGQVSYNAAKITFDVPAELLGQECKILYKSTNNALDTADKIYGVTATGDSKVYEVNFADITIGTGNNANMFKFAGYNEGEYKTIPEALYIFNNNHTMAVRDTANTFNMAAKTPYAVKLVDSNADGVIDMAFSAVPVIGKATTVNAAKYDLVVTGNRPIDTNETKANFEKINFIDEIAKNDIVAVIDDYATGKALVNVEKVDSIVGQITKVNSNGSYVIDGNTYKNSSIFLGGINAAPTGLTTSDATFYVVDNYVVYTEAVANKADQENIVLLLAKNSGNGVFASQQIQVLNVDGTKAIYDYTADADVPSSALMFSQVSPNAIYEYVMNDGKIYLKALATTNADGAATGELVVFNGNGGTIGYNSDSKKFNIVANSASQSVNVNNAPTVNGEKLAADGAFFFIRKGEDWKVLKAEEITSNITSANLYQFALAKSGVPAIKYAVMTGVSAWPTDSTTDAVYGILADSYSTYKVDDEYRYDIVVTLMDGTTKTLTTSVEPKTTSVNDLKKLVTFKENSKGIATIEAAGLAQGTLKAFTGNTLYVNDGTSDVFMTLADDAKIYFVDQKTSSLVVAEGTELVKAGDQVTGNILYKMNSANTKIATIFVEIEGEAIVANTYVK